MLYDLEDLEEIEKFAENENLEGFLLEVRLHKKTVEKTLNDLTKDD